MSRSSYRRHLTPRRLFVLALILLIVGWGIYTVYIFNLEYIQPNQQTILMTSETGPANGSLQARAVVTNRANVNPIENATVTLTLENDSWESEAIEQTAGSNGTITTALPTPPESGQYNITAQTSSQLGQETVTTPVRLEHQQTLYVDTDKPVYQPGQTIAIRGLIQRNRQPWEGTARIRVTGPKGNQLFNRTVQTNQYGMGNVSFPLSSEARPGRYRIELRNGADERSKSVTVKEYRTPQFGIEFQADQAYYRPGENLSATITSEYFFGKPVENATVRVEGAGYIGDLEPFGETTTKTDATGVASVDLTLPRYFAGLPSNDQRGLVVLNISVTDEAGHTERITRRISVAEQDIVLNAFTADGKLVEGVENQVFVTAQTPDGQPLSTTVQIDNNRTITTNEHGVGMASLTPSGPQDRRLHLQVETISFRGSKTVYFELERANRMVIQLNRSTASVGETVSGSVLVGKSSGYVYLDVIADHQTVKTESIPISDNRGNFSVSVSPEMQGSIKIRAWSIFQNNRVGATARRVLVRANQNLSVAVSPNQSIYRPGQPARVSVRTEREGTPVPAAVGLDIVDESVFALEERRTGLAALHFRLEEELLKPEVFIHNYTPERMQAPPETSADRVAETAGVARMQAKPNDNAVNSFDKRLQEIRTRQQSYGEASGALMLWLVTLLPLGVVVSALVRFDPETIRKKATAGIAGLVVGVLGTGIVAGVLLAMLMANVGLGVLAFFVTILGAGYGLYRLAKSGSFGQRGSEAFSRDLSILAGAYILLILLAIFASSLLSYRTVTQLFPVTLLSMLLFPLGVAFAADTPSASFQRAMAISFALLLVLAPMGLPFFVFGLGANQQASPGFGFAADGDGAPPASEDQSGSTATDVRQYFPETLHSGTVLTGADGQATVEVQMADSITRWRLSSIAADRTGTIGSNRSSMRVFQPFFIKPAVPVSLTQRDQVTIPVSVFNYANQTQTVEVSLASASWFETNRSSGEVTVPSERVRVVNLTITAVENGEHALTIAANASGPNGSIKTDAVRKQVRVDPYGRRVETVDSGTISGSTRTSFQVPQRAVNGSSKAVLRVYPGTFSQVVGGLDALLEMPTGCFEQTSSSLYPNILALKYMDKTGQINPEIRMTAERYIASGYQRILTFETDTPGGYSLFGNNPPNLLLTAYGLQQLTDMNTVYQVDEQELAEMQQYLKDNQAPDGYWEGGRLEYPLGVSGDRMSTTAYVTWSLAYSGASDEAVDDGTAFLNRNLEPPSAETMTLAVSLNALAEAEAYPGLQQDIYRELDSRAKTDADGIYWTHEGSEGQDSIHYGSKEVLTTATVANAYVAGTFAPHQTDRALEWLIQQKTGRGGWGSTQNTVMTLRALTSATEGTGESSTGTLTVQHNGEAVTTRALTDETKDELQTIILPTTTGENTIDITGPSNGSLAYELSHAYHVPWSGPTGESGSSPIGMNLSYNRTSLTVDDTVTGEVTVRAENGTVGMALLDFGVPPGFELDESSLDHYVDLGTISRYEHRGRQIIVYIEDLDSSRSFSFALRATQPIEAESGAARIYDYYHPNTEAIQAPVRFHVNASG